jgi:23S rRNA pseudouridine2605 synthase
MENDLPRLQKVLSAAGVASRRASETIIAEGRVTVNGVCITAPGAKVDPAKDTICVDGIPLEPAQESKKVYLMLNKPVGYTCTVQDKHAEHTIMELVTQVKERVYPVGRLDADSEGVLLLTNDGEFANRLTHPRYHVPKRYRVRVKGFVERETAIRLRNGIELEDGKTAPADVAFVDFDSVTQASIIEITLYEGRNRQVRRMMEAVGHPVRALQRVAFGNLTLNRLNVGTYRKLTPEEVAGLLAMAQAKPTPKKLDLPQKPRIPHTKPRPRPEEKPQ